MSSGNEIIWIIIIIIGVILNDGTPGGSAEKKSLIQIRSCSLMKIWVKCM